MVSSHGLEVHLHPTHMSNTRAQVAEDGDVFEIIKSLGLFDSRIRGLKEVTHRFLSMPRFIIGAYQVPTRWWLPPIFGAKLHNKNDPVTRNLRDTDNGVRGVGRYPSIPIFGVRVLGRLGCLTGHTNVSERRVVPTQTLAKVARVCTLIQFASCPSF